MRPPSSPRRCSPRCSCSRPAAADDGAGDGARRRRRHDDAGRRLRARRSAGERARVDGPARRPNADPHDYEVRPDDVKELADAALVVRSGGELDEWLEGAIESAGTERADVLTLRPTSARRRRRPALVAGPAQRDPRRRGDRAPRSRGPTRRARRPTARARAALHRRLDGSTRGSPRCIGEGPGGRAQARHDPRRARLLRRAATASSVVGAVIPSLSTAAQPSAGEIAALVETIRREGVKAIFAESSVEPERRAGDRARVGRAASGRPLWADTLGPAGSDGATYVRLDRREHARASSTGSAAARCPAGCRLSGVLEPLRPLHAARAARGAAARGARRRARELDRAAPARLLHPRGRHRRPSPGWCVAGPWGDRAAARRARRGARLRRRAGAARAHAGGSRRRRDRPAARRARWRSASCSRRTSTSRARGSTRCCSAR